MQQPGRGRGEDVSDESGEARLRRESERSVGGDITTVVSTSERYDSKASGKRPSRIPRMDGRRASDRALKVSQ